MQRDTIHATTKSAYRPTHVNEKVNVFGKKVTDLKKWKEAEVKDTLNFKRAYEATRRASNRA